jgi:flagellar biosynthesis protein FlgN
VNQLNDSLSAVLNEQIRCAESMLDVLERENQALVANDADLLTTTGADKARLVDALEKLEIERRDLTQAFGAAAASIAGGTGPQSSPEWQELIALVATCKERNQRNGALVKARSDQVRALLNSLRSSEPAMYAASGNVHAGSLGTRPLGTA